MGFNTAVQLLTASKESHCQVVKYALTGINNSISWNDMSSAFCFGKRDFEHFK